MHAWMGVGSLNPLQAARRPSGTSSWSKETMGVMGVVLWMVMAFSVRKASTSEDEGAEAVVREDEATGVSSTTSVLRFFSFFSFLDEPAASSSKMSLDLRFLSFFSFFEGCSPAGVSETAEASSSPECSRFFLCFFSFFEGLSSATVCSSSTIPVSACSLRLLFSFLSFLCDFSVASSAAASISSSCFLFFEG